MSAALRDELVNDPLSRGYASMSDAEIAASLNVKDRAAQRPIPSAELLAWAAADGRYDKINDAANNHASPAVRSLASAGRLMIQRDGTELNLAIADRAAMVAALVGADVLSADDKTSLEALAIQQTSRAAELGIGVVRAGHVKRARS